MLAACQLWPERIKFYVYRCVTTLASLSLLGQWIYCNGRRCLSTPHQDVGMDAKTAPSWSPPMGVLLLGFHGNHSRFGMGTASNSVNRAQANFSGGEHGLKAGYFLGLKYRMLKSTASSVKASAMTGPPKQRGRGAKQASRWENGGGAGGGGAQWSWDARHGDKTLPLCTTLQRPAGCLEYLSPPISPAACRGSSRSPCSLSHANPMCRSASIPTLSVAQPAPACKSRQTPLS